MAVAHRTANVWRAESSTAADLLGEAFRGGVHDHLLLIAKQRLVKYAADHARDVLRYIRTDLAELPREAIEAAEAYAKWTDDSEVGAVVQHADLLEEDMAQLTRYDEELGHPPAGKAAAAAASAHKAVASVSGGQLNEFGLRRTATMAQSAAEWAEAAWRGLPLAPYVPWAASETAEIVRRVIPWPRNWKTGDIVAHGDRWVLYHAYDKDYEPMSPPLFSAQVTPRGKFRGWIQEVSLYDAIDFIGHEGPKAMQDALQQVRQEVV